MTRYLIRIPARLCAEQDPFELLDVPGISADKAYGAVPLDADGSAFVLRADGDATVIEDLARTHGLELFPDIGITATKGAQRWQDEEG